jgi:hypothetical protein
VSALFSSLSDFLRVPFIWFKLEIVRAVKFLLFLLMVYHLNFSLFSDFSFSVFYSLTFSKYTLVLFLHYFTYSYPCNRPCRPIGLWDVEASRHFLDSWLTDGGEVLSLTRRPAVLYSPGRFLVLISVRCWVKPRAIVRLEGLGQLKNLMASSGIEPA